MWARFKIRPPLRSPRLKKPPSTFSISTPSKKKVLLLSSTKSHLLFSKNAHILETSILLQERPYSGDYYSSRTPIFWRFPYFSKNVHILETTILQERPYSEEIKIGTSCTLSSHPHRLQEDLSGSSKDPWWWIDALKKTHSIMWGSIWLQDSLHSYLSLHSPLCICLI